MTTSRQNRQQILLSLVRSQRRIVHASIMRYRLKGENPSELIGYLEDLEWLEQEVARRGI